MLLAVSKTRSGLLSAVDPRIPELSDSFRLSDKQHDQYSVDVKGGTQDHPHSMHVQPVYQGFGSDMNDSKLVGIIASVVPWDKFLANLLPEGVEGITAVLANTCNQSYTFVLVGRKVGQKNSEHSELISTSLPCTNFYFFCDVYISVTGRFSRRRGHARQEVWWHRVRHTYQYLQIQRNKCE